MKNRLWLWTLLAVAAIGPTRVLADDVGVIAQDRARIREHLSAVETYLRAQDTSHLDDAQRAAREENLDRLRDYWVAGVFPHNTLTGHPTPIFVDPEGRACAVGFLMLESGFNEAVEGIVASQNLAYVNDIDSLGVAEWLEESGLTAQEAAWIQPTYNPCNDLCECEVDPVCGADGTTYVSSCFAENCAVELDYESGCCEVEARIAWSGDLVDEFFAGARLCETDPNDLTEQLCAEAVVPPVREGDASPNCSATALPNSVRWHVLLALSSAFLWLRRRGKAA